MTCFFGRCKQLRNVTLGGTSPLHTPAGHLHQQGRPYLLHLPLVAAVAGLPALERLQLSLTFSREASDEQQSYLLLLGHVLRIQQRQRQLTLAHQRASNNDARVQRMQYTSTTAAAGGNICLTVHEHCQGDLSAGEARSPR